MSVLLSNGLRLVNFGLGDVLFEDGTLLPGAPTDVKPIFVEQSDTYIVRRKIVTKVTRQTIGFSEEPSELSKYAQDNNVDIILMPLEILGIIKDLQHGLIKDFLLKKCRSPIFDKHNKAKIMEYYRG